jgi:hypothetical protein
MKHFLKMAVAAVVAGAAFAAQSSIVIDDFTVASPTVDVPNIGTFSAFSDGTVNGLGIYGSQNGALTSIIGGQRDMFIEKVSGGQGIMAAQVASGQYSYSTPNANPLVVGKGFLKWDGQNGVDGSVISGSQANFLATLDPTGLGGVNLYDGGNAFRIDVVNSDLGFDFALTVYSSAVDFTTLVLQSAAHLNGVPASSPILFADFEGACGFCVLGSGALKFTGGAGADLSNVGALLAEVNWSGSSKEIDLSIDQVITVPEPTSLALVGVGLVAFGVSRRRKVV